MNEYGTINFVKSQFRVSSKSKTSILRIEVYVAIFLKNKWKKICNLGLPLPAQKKKIIRKQQFVFLIFAHITYFYNSIQYTEIKEHNESKYSQHSPQINFSGNLPIQEQTERWNILIFFKDNGLISTLLKYIEKYSSFWLLMPSFI